MYNSPYETLPMKGLKLNNIISALEIAKAEGSLKNNLLETAPTLYVVAGKSAVSETIPPFTQAITFKTLDGEATAIDLRPYNSVLFKGGEFKDPVGGSGELAVRTALLQTIWQKQGPGPFVGLSNLPLVVFSQWISSTLGRLLGLTVGDVVTLQTIAAWYWLCLFIKDGEIPVGKDLVRYASKIANNGIADYDTVLNIITEVGYLEDIKAFSAAVAQMNTARTDRVSSTTIYSSLASGWFGSAYARQQVSIALEYPPMFISILYTAVSEKGFRKAPISEIAKFYNKRNSHEDFMAAVNSLIRAYGV